MSDSDNAQPTQEVRPEEHQEALQSIAKPKRKPRESKKGKVIVVSVIPTEIFDDHQNQRKSSSHQRSNLALKQWRSPNP